MSKFQSAQFKKLQKEYYELLQKEGFSDLEDPNNPDHCIKRAVSSYRRMKIDLDPQEYYLMAQQFLDVCIFKSDRERRIWEMHSEGLTIRQIAGACSDKGYSVGGVHAVIKKLKAMMLWKYK